MKRMAFVLISILLLCSITLQLTGCFMKVEATNLMDGVSAQRISALDDLTDGNSSVTDFAVRLLLATNEEGKNVLISPLSVISALAMTANGADGETLAEMESALGLNREALNLYLYSYLNKLPEGEKYKLSVANSIWFTDDEHFLVSGDFLQTNANYYGADIYKAPFNNRTLKDINNWVKRETDRMIPSILDRVPEDAVMYLINALAFEAEWAKIYEKHQVREEVFTKEDGTEINADFMYSNESRYISDENAQGFIKYYNGGKYAFAALLPNKNVSVSDYLLTLDGESLQNMLSNYETCSVMAAIPKFKSEYSAELREVLKSMGMSTAFDEKTADFSAIGESAVGNIYISRVLHKTYIEVGERGTKAGAVTVVEMKNESAAGPFDEPKKVYLDRPFVYMLIDTENNIPFFIGTMMDINEK